MSLQKYFIRVDKFFADEIHAAKHERDQYHLDLANALGCSVSQVRNYVNGNTQLKARQMEAVMQVFDKYGIKYPPNPRLDLTQQDEDC